jgi:hypothetical protein
MTTVNQTNLQTDQTVRIYDLFYDYTANIPVLEYEAVLSYFESVFKTPAGRRKFQQCFI